MWKPPNLNKLITSFKTLQKKNVGVFQILIMGIMKDLGIYLGTTLKRFVTKGK